MIAQLRAALLKPKYTLEELELAFNATKKKKAATNTTSGLKSFPITAWWRPLIPNKEARHSITKCVRLLWSNATSGRSLLNTIPMNNLIFQCMRRQTRYTNNKEDVIGTR